MPAPEEAHLAPKSGVVGKALTPVAHPLNELFLAALMLGSALSDLGSSD
jgi:hypothetical protein